MRHFELTIGVYLGDRRALPESFEEWLRVAFGDEAVDQIGASPTKLVAVVETRYPLAEDVVERRRGEGIRSPRYA